MDQRMRKSKVYSILVYPDFSMNLLLKWITLHLAWPIMMACHPITQLGATGATGQWPKHVARDWLTCPKSSFTSIKEPVEIPNYKFKHNIHLFIIVVQMRWSVLAISSKQFQFRQRDIFYLVLMHWQLQLCNCVDVYNLSFRKNTPWH